MPVTPYPVSGTVYDTDGTTAVSGATIDAWNERTGKKMTPSGTSNSSGSYIIDLANFPSHDYEDGDAVTIQAKSGNKIVLYRTTIVTANYQETKNLTLEYLDPLNVIEDLLSNGWDNSSTDGITPTVAPIFDQKEIDQANSDYILLYSTDEGFKPFNIGGTTFHEQPMISMDIRTTYKKALLSDVREHLIKLKREVYRLIKANIRNPGKPYILLVPRRSKDLTDKRIGMGRTVVDVEINRWGA